MLIIIRKSTTYRSKAGRLNCNGSGTDWSPRTRSLYPVRDALPARASGTFSRCRLYARPVVSGDYPKHIWFLVPAPLALLALSVSAIIKGLPENSPWMAWATAALASATLLHLLDGWGCLCWLVGRRSAFVDPPACVANAQWLRRGLAGWRLARNASRPLISITLSIEHLTLCSDDATVSIRWDNFRQMHAGQYQGREQVALDLQCYREVTVTKGVTETLLPHFRLTRAATGSDILIDPLPFDVTAEELVGCLHRYARHYYFRVMGL